MFDTGYLMLVTGWEKGIQRPASRIQYLPFKNGVFLK